MGSKHWFFSYKIDLNPFINLLENYQALLWWIALFHTFSPSFKSNCWSSIFYSFLHAYSCVFNTSHTVLGDMPNFYEKPVCITRHAIPFYERPGCNTEHTNSLLMWQWHHYCFEVTREGLRPGCNSRHGTLFTQRPGWNKRIWGKIQWVLNRSPATCIQD